MHLRLIGVDYSTDPKNVGLACADYTKGGRIVIDAVEPGKTLKFIKDTVIGWINKDGAEKVLLAIDAPLGWPKPLGEALVLHEAGSVLSEQKADCLFMRKTDLWIKKRYKNPLSVGADQIARTAHAALSFLNILRSETKHDIPLAWNCSQVANAGISAIEVYPAATLIAHGLPHKNLKKKHNKDNRAKVIKRLKDKLTLHKNVNKVKTLEKDDMFDAVLCVLAAADFVDGEAVTPECALAKKDRALVKDEGWIWVKRRSKNSKTRRLEGKESRAR